MNDRAAWLAARRTGIGGTDISAIVGLSPWRTPLDVYYDKRGELEPLPGNEEAMYWGQTLEDVVAREYGRRTQRAVQRVNAQLRHPDHEWMIGNIDRAIINPAIAGNVRWKDGRLTTDRILECKTANSFAANAWGEPGTDLVPEYYVGQVQWYMGITQADACDLAVLIGGQDYRIYTIVRDDQLIADLMAAGQDFWRRVQDGDPPPPQTLDDARRLWPRHVAAKRVVVDVAIAQACLSYQSLTAEIKQLEGRADDLKVAIMAAMGDAEEASHGGRKLATWKANKDSTRVDWQAVAAALAPSDEQLRAAVAAHTESKPGARVLRIANTQE